MEGHVSHGKRKIKGHQRPYYWSAGRQFLGGIDLGAKLLAAMRMTGLGHASARGLLPDFGPARVKFANLRTIQKSLMPHARISALSSAMFRAAGASPAQLETLEGLYAARHVLPTLGDAVRLEDTDRLSLGSWSDQGSKARMAMPNLYSQSRLWREATVKHTVIMCAQSALDSFAKSHAGKWPSSWAAIFELLPRKEFSLGITANGSRIEGTRNRALLLSREEIDLDTPLSVLALGEISDAPSTGDKDGAASSESSSSSSRSCEPKIEADPFGSIEWQLAKGPRGMIHILNGDEMACHRNRLLHPQ